MADTLANVTASAAAYQLGETLGVGAIASVVRVTAHDGQTYAGKVLHASHESDAAAVARFMQEAELLEGLDHDNVVGVSGVAEIEGRQVLLLELVEGPTLQSLIAREAPMPEPRLVQLALGIARGLERAHAAGIIHRDLKPANVLVAGGGVPKIADFGMARATSMAGVDRSAFTVLGTPDYMAPESMDPLAVDPRADLYALGCIAYEMATGNPPFTAATPFGVIEQHRDARIPKLPAEFSPGLQALVESLLSKSPADRPQAAATVVASLERIEAGDGEALMALAKADEDGARCAGCGQRLLLELGVCLNCGLATAKVEPGGCTLLVAGPGQVGDKLDSGGRERLVNWIRQNPGLQMDPGELAKRIPRLPFTLATGISAASGRAVAASLEKLGFETELVKGGAWKSTAMRKKVKSLSARVLGIIAVSSAWIYGQLNWGTAVAIPVVILGALGFTAISGTRRLTTPRPTAARALPPSVGDAVTTVEKALPAIEQARHRHGLRAAVGRALQLSADPGLGPEVAEELAQSIRLATVAAARLDALDRQLADREFNESSAEARALLHERDLWAARLLELTATLDSLRARSSAATAKRADADDEALEDLRARIEALEEVQAS
jgi:hypothetical protein